MTKKVLKYAEHRGTNPEDVVKITKNLDVLKLKPLFHSSGFDHPQLPIFTNENPLSIEMHKWGLIPQNLNNSNKIPQIINKTLLARAETIFETQVYKDVVINNRCLVMLDGFFEHHHINGRTIPFFIQFADFSPMFLAGIYNITTLATGENYKSCALVTTEANDMMKKIHNNPKADGARMPVILSKNNFETWLVNKSIRPNEVTTLFRPHSINEMMAYPVSKLRIKEETNISSISEPFEYKELRNGYHSIKPKVEQLSLF